MMTDLGYRQTGEHLLAGLVTNTILFSASVVIDCVFGPTLRAHQTLSFHLYLEAMQEARLGHLKGTVSAQKALQGSEKEKRELLEGTKENNILPNEGGVYDCVFKLFMLVQAKNYFKKPTGKIGVVARPG